MTWYAHFRCSRSTCREELGRIKDEMGDRRLRLKPPYRLADGMWRMPASEVRRQRRGYGARDLANEQMHFMSEERADWYDPPDSRPRNHGDRPAVLLAVELGTITGAFIRCWKCQLVQEIPATALQIRDHPSERKVAW